MADIKFDRMEESILLVLFEVYPLGLNKEEIMNKIIQYGLLEMSDEEFKKFKKNLVATKTN